MEESRSELLPGQRYLSFPQLSTDAFGKSGMNCRCLVCDTKCLSAFTRGKADIYFKSYIYTKKTLILTICFRRWENCLAVVSEN